MHATTEATIRQTTALTTIRGAQSGRVMYPEFKRRTQAAGCIGHTVWLAGRHLSCYRWRGEVHVEHFPS